MAPLQQFQRTDARKSADIGRWQVKGRQSKSLGKLADRCSRQFSLLLAAFLIASCGSSSREDGGQANRAPAANAGGDQNAIELTTVNLSGSGTDPDNDTLTFAWTQSAGTNVTLSSPNAALANFTAPDVTVGVPDILTFQLTVTDPSGLSSVDSVSITVQEPAAVVTISGVLTYEFPPPNALCRGLDFGNIEIRPIRQATVQMLDASGTTVLDSTISDNSGAYSMTVNASTDVIIRVRAELAAATWNVQVRNNVDTSGSPPPLGQRPMYAMDLPFNSGIANDPNRNLVAVTGWGGSGYIGTRVAAPFAILDTIYTAMQFVIAEDPNANFAPLDAFWSPDNKSASPTDIDLGDLPTSFYNGNSSLFLLGMEGVDTEEFDDHVVVHEWGHYFEDNFSRSDSIGGSHGSGDLLDMRTAFGEGWASALAAMSLDDPLYCDTASSNSGGGFNAESSSFGPAGWFNEQTVISFIYDLWDTDNDGVDNDSIGFSPIYDVMTGPQSTTGAFTSIFTFVTYLKQQGTGKDAFINTLLTDAGINPTSIDIWGSSESNAGGATEDVFDIYTPLTLGGAAINLCVNSQFDSGRTGNKLSEHRYLTLNLPSPRQVTFSVTANPEPSQASSGFDCTADPDDAENNEHSDPDFLVWRNGQLFVVGFGCEPNSEITTSSGVLAAGNYLIDLNEFRHEDDDSPVAFPEQVCFDVAAN
jgi:hypothetical protein